MAVKTKKALPRRKGKTKSYRSTKTVMPVFPVIPNIGLWNLQQNPHEGTISHLKTAQYPGLGLERRVDVGLAFLERKYLILTGKIREQKSVKRNQFLSSVNVVPKIVDATGKARNSPGYHSHGRQHPYCPIHP